MWNVQPSLANRVRPLPAAITGTIVITRPSVSFWRAPRSAPPLVYGYPAEVCISVNDEAMHGIPGARVIRPGDLVKLDLVAEKDGFYADAALSVNVPQVSHCGRELAYCAERAFRQALTAARAGNRVYEIGRAVEREVRRSGFSVIRELCGHGVGRPSQ